jgi:hypothetical protein
MDEEQEELEYMFAVLIDHFKLTPQQIGKLTRYQIARLYFWDRDERGVLKPPGHKLNQPKTKPEPTKEEKLKVLEFLASLNLKDPSKLDALRKKIDEGP